MALFPHASSTFFDLNRAVQPAESESAVKHALERSDKGKEKSSPRIIVRYRIFRRRLQDLDNAFGSTKALTDTLSLCGLIPDDSPDKISLQIEQEKVHSFSDERTEVKITWPNLKRHV